MVSHARQWAAASGHSLASTLAAGVAHGDPTKAWARWRDDVLHDLCGALDGSAKAAATLLADARPQAPDGWYTPSAFHVDADGAHHASESCDLVRGRTHRVDEPIADVGNQACPCTAQSNGGSISPDHLGYRQWKRTGIDLLAAARRVLESIRDDDHIDVDATIAMVHAAGAHASDAPWDPRALVAAHATARAATERAVADGTADAALWIAAMCVHLDQSSHDRTLAHRSRKVAGHLRDHLLAGRDPDRIIGSVARARQGLARELFTTAHERTATALGDSTPPSHAASGFGAKWNPDRDEAPDADEGSFPWLTHGVAPARLRWDHIARFPAAKVVAAAFLRVEQFNVPLDVDPVPFHPSRVDDVPSVPLARHAHVDGFIELIDRLARRA